MNEKISPPSRDEALKITLKYIDKFIKLAPYELAEEYYYNTSGMTGEKFSLDRKYYDPVFKAFNSVFKELIQNGILEIKYLKGWNFKVDDLPYHLYELTDEGKKYLEELNISDEEIGNYMGTGWGMRLWELKNRYRITHISEDIHN